MLKPKLLPQALNAYTLLYDWLLHQAVCHQDFQSNVNPTCVRSADKERTLSFPRHDLIVPFCCPFPDAQPSAPRDHPQRDMGTSLAPHGRALQGPSGESQGGAAHRFCSRQLLWGTAEFVSSAATGKSLWVGDRLKFLMQLFFFPDKYF